MHLCNKREFQLKLFELQRQLEIEVDLNRIVSVPSEKDLKTLEEIRQAQDQLENLKAIREKLESS